MPKLTDREFVEAVSDLLADSVFEMTPEEIDEELREAGYDPDATAEHYRVFARDLLAMPAGELARSLRARQEMSE